MSYNYQQGCEGNSPKVEPSLIVFTYDGTGRNTQDAYTRLSQEKRFSSYSRCDAGFQSANDFAREVEGVSAYEPEYKSDRITFSDKSIRVAFIRKVYGILMIQLLVTFGFVALFVLNESIKLWSRRNIGVFHGALAVSLLLFFAMLCSDSVRRRAPGNFICLGIFTIAEGFTLGTFSSAFEADSVLVAVGMTAVICLSLTIFSFETKYDFTLITEVLLVALIAFTLSGFMLCLLPRTQFPVSHVMCACMVALFFSIYLILDTELMIEGNRQWSISPEEYIFTVLNLYLDIVNMFVHILSSLKNSD